MSILRLMALFRPWLMAMALGGLLLLCAGTALARTGKAATAAHTIRPAASPPAATLPAAGPAQVHVGIYVMRINALSFRDNQFKADFYVWFRWLDPKLKPYETFEISNGAIDSRTLTNLGVVQGYQYACLRVQATLSKFWTMDRYPLDVHHLTLEIEDNQLDDEDVVFLADSDCGIDSNFRIPGWTLQGASAQVVQHGYKIDHGNVPHEKGKQTDYSRFIFGIDIGRESFFHSLQILTTLYLSILVAFTIFFVRPDHRLALIVGSVFAIVASHSAVCASLPDLGHLTLVDKLHMMAIAVICTALFETAYALHLHQREKLAAARALDRATLILTAAAFIGGNAWLYCH